MERDNELFSPGAVKAVTPGLWAGAKEGGVPKFPDSFSHDPLTLPLRTAGIDICRINKINSSVKSVLNGFFCLFRFYLFSESYNLSFQNCKAYKIMLPDCEHLIQHRVE